MAESFKETADALLKGMENFLTTKTVVGEAIHVGDTIILPLMDVSFGVASSVKNEPQKHNGGGGMGGKMSPSALLVISNGTTRLISVKNQDSMSKLIDTVPDLISRFRSGGTSKEVKEACDEAAARTENFDE